MSPTDNSLTTPTDPDHVVRSNSELPHADEIEKAKITAQCILYGRVDGAQIFADTKLKKEMCSEPNHFGMDVLMELVRKANEGTTAG